MTKNIEHPYFDFHGAAAPALARERRQPAGKGAEHDQLETDDKFMRHPTQVVRNGLGDRTGRCIDPTVQIVQERTVCVVSCQRIPEP